MLRASGIAFTTDQRSTPSRSTTNVPRTAQPRSASNTPYDEAIAPCGQKSVSSEKPNFSASAQARRAYIGSHDTASTSASASSKTASSSRISASSPEHTPLNANG